MSEKPSKNIRTLMGVVVSDKMQNSFVVRVDRKVKHPLYAKYVLRSTRFHVHDIENKAKLGDVVLIKECRPISKTKAWELVDIIETVR